ncbi:hypothetical protein Scep_024466 [Stephania cephalantha]|uniref:Uncharacterized protein n=1 Tax=Stephania cephalantha TaxID=152367 RepID=A0AAP0EXU0_9MAGN
MEDALACHIDKPCKHVFLTQAGAVLEQALFFANSNFEDDENDPIFCAGSRLCCHLRSKLLLSSCN